MKKSLLLITSLVFIGLNAQVNWQNFAGGPTTGFWDMDTMNGKLYVSDGLVNEFDGNNWTVLSDYNNSLNTPNKSKSCVKNLNGNLYCGAKDFNTTGEGDVHYYNGTSWTLFQNTDFPYNGSYKIRSFCNYNSDIYMSGNFEVPNNTSFRNIAKWNGTDWVTVGRNFISNFSPTEITDMESFQGNLFITDKSNVWKFNGSTWDSIFNPLNVPFVFPMSGTVNDMIIFNNELYFSGMFYLDANNMGIPLIKYNGSSFSPVARNIGGAQTILITSDYESIGKMGIAGGKLVFVAKKSADQNTYLVSYDGANVTEETQLAVSGDYTFAAGSEYTTYTRLFEYNNTLIIGGNFQKIGGLSQPGLAHVPTASVIGLKSEKLKTSVNVFPNPSNDNIQFTFTSTEKPSLLIYNQLGQVIKNIESVNSNEKIEHELKTGIYFYELRFNEFSSKGKLVVSR